MNDRKRAILVVSFGTSYEDTRKRTIDQIEADIQEAYPDCPVYRAWTSKMICRKIEKRDGIHIMGVREALEKMAAEGIREVAVQPTHVINGFENDGMAEDIAVCQGLFERIVTGTPLLTTQEDNEQAVRVVAEELAPSDTEALVLMGHGTEHYANSIYAALDYQFKDMGYGNIHMGTVEAYPALESLMKQVKGQNPERVLLAPFMIVAGDHAANDLSGEDEDSWKSRFEAAGFNVSCILRGLGEYPGIRKIFLEHVADSMAQLDG